MFFKERFILINKELELLRSEIKELRDEVRSKVINKTTIKDLSRIDLDDLNVRKVIDLLNYDKKLRTKKEIAIDLGMRESKVDLITSRLHKIGKINRRREGSNSCHKYFINK